MDAQRLQNLQVIRSFEAIGHRIHAYRDGKWTALSVRVKENHMLLQFCCLSEFHSLSLFLMLLQTEQLVPGDLVSLERSEDPVPCDVLLLSGRCIVNEALLTGESVPQLKVYIHIPSWW